MSFTGTTPTVEIIDGRKHILFDVTGANVAANDELELEVPRFVTMTLLHVTMPTPGSASTVDPEVGVAASFAAGSIDEQHANGAAAAAVRERTRIAIVAREGSVFIRPKPDNTCTAMRIVVAFVEGHEE